MEISLGEAITMSARNKPDAPSFVFADGSAHTNDCVIRLAVFSLDLHRYVEIVLAALNLGAV